MRCFNTPDLLMLNNCPNNLYVFRRIKLKFKKRKFYTYIYVASIDYTQVLTLKDIIIRTQTDKIYLYTVSSLTPTPIKAIVDQR